MIGGRRTTSRTATSTAVATHLDRHRAIRRERSHGRAGSSTAAPTDLRPGTVVVSAVDGTSGVTSDDPGGRSAILHVFGDIVRLVLTPPTTTLEVGQARTLTTVAHHARGGTESVTQQSGVRRAIRPSWSRPTTSAIGAGSSPSDPARPRSPPAISTPASPAPRAATTTVVTGPPRRFSRAARVVADDPTGCGRCHDALRGRRDVRRRDHPQLHTRRSIDLGWTSDRGRHECRRRSEPRRHVRAGHRRYPVRDPSLVFTSTDTWGRRDPEQSKRSPRSRSHRRPSSSRPAHRLFLTTVGEVTGADSFNLTQDVVYVSSDPDVVQATNGAGQQEPDRRRRPGVATITAFRASTYPQATDSNSITVTVSPVHSAGC